MKSVIKREIDDALLIDRDYKKYSHLKNHDLSILPDNTNDILEYDYPYPTINSYASSFTRRKNFKTYMEKQLLYS
jgi:hypothetical protein